MNTRGNLPVKALDTKHREAQEQTDQGYSFQKMMLMWPKPAAAYLR